MGLAGASHHDPNCGDLWPRFGPFLGVLRPFWPSRGLPPKGALAAAAISNCGSGSAAREHVSVYEYSLICKFWFEIPLLGVFEFVYVFVYAGRTLGRRAWCWLPHSWQGSCHLSVGGCWWLFVGCLLVFVGRGVLTALQDGSGAWRCGGTVRAEEEMARRMESGSLAVPWEGS